MPVWIRRALTVLGALAAAPAACALALPLNVWFRGRNVSDVGVSMYEYPDRGLLAGLALIAVICPLMLGLLARTIGNRGSLAYWVGIPCMLVLTEVFLLVAPW
jgi:hypothetical protein